MVLQAANAEPARAPPASADDPSTVIQALRVNGRHNESLGLFEQAAEQYEQLVELDPKATDAASALERAALFRLGLGQVAEVERDARRFEVGYGRANPDALGMLALQMAARSADEDRWDAVEERLRAVVSRVDRTGSPDTRILVHAELGRAAGQLNKEVRAGAEWHAVRSWWKRPIAALADPSSEGSALRLRRVLDAVSEAWFLAAEQRRARVVALAAPIYDGPFTLSALAPFFNVRVAPWLKHKDELIGLAEAAYVEVTAVQPEPGPRWRVAAAARVGEMWASFAHDLRLLPYPAGPIPGGGGLTYEQLRAAYADYIDPLDQQYDARAAQAYSSCWQDAQRYRVVDEVARGCESWLAHHRRAEFPAAMEEFVPSRVWLGLPLEGQPALEWIGTHVSLVPGLTALGTAALGPYPEGACLLPAVPALAVRISPLTSMSSRPSMFSPRPRHTPQNVSPQVLPSASAASPVSSKASANAGSLNLLRSSSRMIPTFASSQSGRSWSVRPSFLLLSGAPASRTLARTSGSSVLAAAKACSTLG
jgi:tetratricopeptide (TPR) repeat protein